MDKDTHTKTHRHMDTGRQIKVDTGRYMDMH